MGIVIWDGREFVPFVEGVEEDGETIEGNPEGQTPKTEPTFAELRQEAKAREIEGYGKMTKLELIEALKEGD
jgi:hypothetical protein